MSSHVHVAAATGEAGAGAYEAVVVRMETREKLSGLAGRAAMNASCD